MIGCKQQTLDYKLYKVFNGTPVNPSDFDLMEP